MGCIPPRMGAFNQVEGFFLYVKCQHQKVRQTLAKLAASHQKGSQARLGNLQCCGAESAFSHKQQKRQLQTARIALLGLPFSTRDHKTFDSGQENPYYIVKLTVTGSVIALAAVQRRLDSHTTHQSTVMNTYAPTPDDRDDDFELPPLPRFVDYDEFVAKWEEDGRRTRRRMLKLGTAMAARGTRLDLELHHWTVDLEWVEGMVSLHKLCQELQIASPLDGKVCLQTETAACWVERDAYAQNPRQWDSDGQVWVSTGVVV